MRIAFDAEIFYNDNIINYGNIEVLLGIYCMNPLNEIYVLGDSITDAKRAGHIGNFPTGTKYEHRTGYREKTDIYFARPKSLTKQNVNVTFIVN